jgi:hypothetical protein
MRFIRTSIIAMITVWACTSAYAAHYSDLYVIPVVSHTAGQYGTNWMSDVAIQNFAAAPLTVQLIFIASGEGRLDNVTPVITGTVNGSVTVPAGGSVLLKDVLASMPGIDSAIGSLILGGDRPFAVTSRAYSMTPDGNTIGQTVPPSANFLNVTEGSTDLSTAVAYIPGLIQNDRFRTNLGLVVANATGFNSVLNVTVTVRNAAGTTVGTRQIRVGPGAVTHLQVPVRSLSGAGTASFDIGSAEFRITEGSGSVVSYASVIDNQTADAVFITGNFPDNGTSALSKGMFLQSPFRDLLQRHGVGASIR